MNAAELCSLHLDLLVSDKVQIHRESFHIELNSGTLYDIQLTTTITSQIYFKNISDFLPVTTFSIRDIVQGHIWYVVKDNKTRVDRQHFGLNFSIGHSELVHVQFQVCLNLLPYPQLSASSSLALLLPEHGDIGINPTVLSSVNTVNQIFGVWYELTVPPTNGELVKLLGGPVFKFTQEDIVEGNIYYHNHNYSSDGDKFVLALSNQFYEHTANITIAIDIFLLRLKVVNNGFSVREGDKHTIVRNELYAKGPHGYNVMIYIETAPLHGNITLNSNKSEIVNKFSKEQLDNGLVVYTNDDEEHLNDSMIIRIEAVHDAETPAHIRDSVSKAKNTTYVGVVHITIELVNDNTPVEWNVTRENEVVVGSSITITSHILSFLDYDIDMNISLLRYSTIYGPSYGNFFFRHNNSIVHHFLQQNIYDLEVGYQNNKPDNSAIDICVLGVSDGENVGRVFLRFVIVPFIVEPVNNESLLLDEGSQVVLSHKILLFEAARAEPPANDSEYIYKVTTDPIHGELTIVNSTFTQEELRNGFIIYRHDGSDTCKDNFTFQVTVRGHSSAEMMFFIDIIEIDDEPPSVKYVDQLLVHFGSTAYFNNSILNAMDSDAELSDLVFNVLREPVFGRIKLERTGPRNKFSVISSFTQLQVTEQAIFYEHEKEIDGEWIDNVTLSLHDSINTYSKTIVITFILIPEELPIKVNGITLPEGQIRHLTTQNFEVTHPYLSTLELYIMITKLVTYGHLLALHKPSATFFNSTELNNNSILYFNGEDYETTKDTFKFIATAGEISSKEHTFVFIIELSNDEIPMIIRNSIISVWAGEIKVISRDDLFANDSDADPPDKLKYIIHTNTPLGYFAYNDALHTPITEFYQDDIVDGTVVFKSSHSVNDTELEINFIVTDGKYKVESYITFEINVLTVTVSAQDIVVAMGADQLLSFSAQTNDNSVKREFYYQVLVPPLYGLILNATSDLEVNNFTQEQVNNHQIFYRHIALDQYETADVVNFSVFTDLADPVQTSLNISIQLKKSSTSYLAASNSLDVDEGGIVCLNLSTLDASNVLYEVWKSKNQPIALHDVTVQYIIVSHPSYGEMKIGNATVDKYFEHNDLITPNGVCYYHDGSETTSDHFSVKIKISYNSTDVWYSNNTEILIPIDIRPINDEEPVLKRHTKRIYLFKINNYVTDIHPKDLCLSDEDTIDDNLIYTIVTHNQSMVMCSLSDTPTANFTQSDINNRSVKCKLPSDVSASNLTFYFTDGNFISKNYTVQYSKVDLTLSVVHNMTKLSYSQEEGLTGVTLTTVTLNSSTTGYRGDTIYAVTSQPINGMIILNHSGMVSNFTQLDVDERMIQYRATNSTNYNDSFTVNVTNRHAVSQNITVHVEALAMIGNNYDVNLKLASVNDTQPLPADMFNITRLAMFVKNVLFTVTNELSFGRLELLELHSRKRSSEKFTFDGSQLREGRVLYVLDNKNITNGSEVLRLLVQPENMQAGIAEVSISISVQPSTTSPPSTTPTRSSRPTYNRGSGFTLFALVPTIGVPSFILMVVIILVGFWYSQKRKEKRRCAAAKGIPAICMGSPKFNLPAGHNTITSVDIDFTSERNSDHSSNNSDEGISMAMAPEDQMEDEQQYVEDHLQSRPVLDYTKYYHPLTSVHTSSGYNTPNPQLTHLKKLPVLKNEEYWL